MILDKLTFLQGAALAENDISRILPLIFAFLFVFLIIFVVFYVYMSFAYYYVAKKARLKIPGLAWIPGIGPMIIAYQSSKMHWWPWLLLVGFLIPIINILAAIVFIVYGIIWHWKMFETIGKPGWWAILMIIPIVNFVMIGIAAWSKK